MAHEQRTRWESEGVGVGEGMRCEGVRSSPVRFNHLLGVCLLYLNTYFQQLTSDIYHRLTPCCVVVVVVGIVEVNRRHGKVGRKRASPRSRK